MTMRLRCIVPHCTHTRGQRKGEPPIDEAEEWCCGSHWRLVSWEARRRKADAARLLRRAVRKGLPEGVIGRLKWRAWQAWERCRAEAIERAMGI